MPAARFTLITPACVRIEYDPGYPPPSTPAFEDRPSLFAAMRGVGGEPVVIDDRAGGSPFSISTERFELVFAPSGEGLSPRTLRVRVRGPLAPRGGADGGARETGADGLWTPPAANDPDTAGSRQTGNLGGTLATLDGLRGPVPLPEGLLSRDGWYLIDDSRGHLLTPEGWVQSRPPAAGRTDWYLFAYGRDYRAALAALGAISGPVPMPRRCLLGSWYSRYWPHDSAEYREIVGDYAAHGFPLDVMVLDMDWHREGWTGWSWNRELLPDAEELLRWFRERGLAVTLNLHPADGVGPHEDRYNEFMRAIGRDPGSRETVPFDAGDQSQMRALFREVLAPLERAGVDFWWVDWQQERFVRSIPDLTNLQWLNRIFHAESSREGRRGVSFSRWAGDAAESRWGDHRHPIHFSGDAHTGWAMLRFQVPFTTTAGNVGCFFWSHDIGGHFGPRIEEATARWVQFGAFSAALRLHSARAGVLDRRPWTYAEPFASSMRRAFAMRAELMPYIYSQVRVSCEQMTPLLRPMYIDRPEHPRAYTCPGQYMLGDEVLVAPIVTPGRGPRRVATQAVWFPPPSSRYEPAESAADAPHWRNWHTGERFPPGDEAIVAADIDEIPVFVREGVPVVLGVRNERPSPTGPMTRGGGLGELARVRLWIRSSADGGSSQHTVVLTEDDGISEDPIGARVARTPITAHWSRHGDRIGLELTIGPTSGSFDGQHMVRAWEVEVAGAVSDGPAVVGGDSAAVDHDPQVLGGLVTVRIPGASVRKSVQLRMSLAVSPAGPIDLDAARRFADAFGRSIPADAPPAGEKLRRAVVDECVRAESREHAAEALAIGAGVGLIPCDGGIRLIDTLGWLDGASATVEVVDQIGPRFESRSRQVIALQPAMRSRGAPVQMPREPLAQAALGIRATRWVRATGAMDTAPFEFAAAAESSVAPVPAGAWRALGPFPWDWARSITAQCFSPEHPGGDRAREHVARGQTWHDTGAGAWVSWSEARAGDRWTVDFRRTLGRDSGLAYAATSVTSSRRQHVRLVIESSDKLEAWLNGVRVYSQDGFETEAALHGGTHATLLQGRNSLLVKCASGGGGWGFWLAIDGERAVEAEAELDPSHAAPHPASG